MFASLFTSQGKPHNSLDPLQTNKQTIKKEKKWLHAQEKPLGKRMAEWSHTAIQLQWPVASNNTKPA